MSLKRIVCMTACIFFLVSMGSASAVEPTTFPGTKDKTALNKIAIANPKSAPHVKGTSNKQSNEAGVMIEPTIADPKVAPKTKKK